MLDHFACDRAVLRSPDDATNCQDDHDRRTDTFWRAKPRRSRRTRSYYDSSGKSVGSRGTTTFYDALLGQPGERGLKNFRTWHFVAP